MIQVYNDKCRPVAIGDSSIATYLTDQDVQFSDSYITRYYIANSRLYIYPQICGVASGIINCM